jgi:hypothetical protein
MNIWDADKIVLFIAFFVPGFIALKTYDLFVPGEVRDSSQSLIEAVAYSCINYALLSWLLLIDGHLNLAMEAPIWHGIIMFFILLVSPVALASGYWRLRNTGFIKRYLRHPTPKPWDYIFGKQESFWIIIELTDGTIVGGVYDTSSFASSFPTKEQLYLQQEWELSEHKFIKPKERSSGILVSEKNIKVIRFFK